MKIHLSFIIVLTLAFVGCKETITNNFPTLTDAKIEVEKGWIPRILPASTVGIQESHDLDLNTGSGTFSFGQTDVEQFKKSLTVLGDGEPLGVNEINRRQLKQDGFELYKFEDFYLVVNWTQCRGRFWLKCSR